METGPEANAQTLELLAWISSRPRTYAETMETWGSHCPRHPVWEDALAAGLVQVVRGDRTEVGITPLGVKVIGRTERRG